MKIVIIGGGPIGLATAYFLVKEGYKDVTVIEKRKRCERKQVLNLNDTTADTILPDIIKKEILKDGGGCYIALPDTYLGAYCYKMKVGTFQTRNITVRIDFLVDSLYNLVKKDIKYIQSSSINITPTHIKTEWETVNYDILIGADGAYSQVRKEIFKDPGIKPYKTMYGAVVVFHLPKMNRIIKKNPGKILEYTLDYFQNRIRAFRMTDGYGYLAMMLTHDEYEDKDKVEKALSVLSKFYDFNWNEIKKNIVTFQKVPINMIYAKKFYKEINKKKYFLVGDAAYTSHFFGGAGINEGFNASIYLSTMLNNGHEYNKNIEISKINNLNQTRYVILNLDEIREKCNLNQIDELYYNKAKFPKNPKISKEEKCILAEQTYVSHIPYLRPKKFADLLGLTYIQTKNKQFKKRYERFMEWNLKSYYKIWYQDPEYKTIVSKLDLTKNLLKQIFGDEMPKLHDLRWKIAAYVILTNGNSIPKLVKSLKNLDNTRGFDKYEKEFLPLRLGQKLMFNYFIKKKHTPIIDLYAIFDAVQLYKILLDLVKEEKS